jgi:hypothetical protein
MNLLQHKLLVCYTIPLLALGHKLLVRILPQCLNIPTFRIPYKLMYVIKTSKFLSINPSAIGHGPALLIVFKLSTDGPSPKHYAVQQGHKRCHMRWCRHLPFKVPSRRQDKVAATASD